MKFASLTLALLSLFVFIGVATTTNAASVCLSGLSPPVSATNVIGQSTFTATVTTQLNLPNTVAVSPSTGKVFVSQLGSSPVVRRYASSAMTTNGASIDHSFGTSGCARNRFGVSHVTVDASDNIWIADYGNHRILRIPSASTLSSGTPNADLVLGQSSYTSCMSGSTSSRMNAPHGLVVDSTNNVLYVSDTLNRRILRFDSVSSKSNGAAADVILGTTGTLGCTNYTFNQPFGMAVDSQGNLWVADQASNRVVRYDSAWTKNTGDPIDYELGHACFPGEVTQVGFNTPMSVSFDAYDTLYVADRLNNRVMAFLNAPSIITANYPADFQVGQPDFVTSTIGSASQTSVGNPQGVWFDQVTSNALLTAANGENRVLVYCANS
jgi:DNA-binding beta-propeller fold protein YncE